MGQLKGDALFSSNKYLVAIQEEEKKTKYLVANVSKEQNLSAFKFEVYANIYGHVDVIPLLNFAISEENSIGNSTLQESDWWGRLVLNPKNPPIIY